MQAKNKTSTAEDRVHINAVACASQTQIGSVEEFPGFLQLVFCNHAKQLYNAMSSTAGRWNW